MRQIPTACRALVGIHIMGIVVPRESKNTAEEAAYDVLLLGFDPKNASPELGLKRVFGLDEARARALLAALPTVVTSGVNRVRAEYFSRALTGIGAQIEVRDQHGARVSFEGVVAVPVPAAPPVANDSDNLDIGDDWGQPSAAQPERAAAGWGDLMRDASKPRPAAAPLEKNVPPPSAAATVAEEYGTLSLSSAPPRQIAPIAEQHTDASEYGALSFPPFEEHAALQLQVESLPAPARKKEPEAKPAAAGARVKKAEPAQPAAPRVAVQAQPTQLSPLQPSAAATKPRVQAPVTAIDDQAARSDFWQGFADAVVFPFREHGKTWVIAIGLWALFVNVLSVLAQAVPFIGLTFVFTINTSVMAMSADYHRRCMWAVANDDGAIEEPPDFDPTRILHQYMRQGLHLFAFMALLELPFVLWGGLWLLEHRTWNLSDIVLTRGALFAALVPAAYWPMALTTASLYNRFEGVWMVQVGVRALRRAPLECLSIALVGLLAFMFPWLMCRLLGYALGLPSVFVVTLLGLPLAASHGIMGALSGQLMRSYDKLFE